MSRPWFKVATKIKDDPAMVRLSGEAFKAFIFMLALAAERDDDGAVCQRADLAIMLRLSEKTTKTAIDQLGGRICVDEAGFVRVRDWLQWQPPSRVPEPAEQITERTRRFKERQRERGRNASVPGEERSRNGALELEVEKEVEQETDTPPNGGAAAVAASPAVAPPSAMSNEPAAKPEDEVGETTPKRPAAGPGARLFRRLTNVSPNLEQRSQLEAAFEKHGAERMESVIRDWLLKGYRKQNVMGMLNVLEVGWRERRPPERGILSNGHSMSADEAAAIDQVIAEGMQDAAARADAGPVGAADRLWRDVHSCMALRMPAATLKAWVDPVQVAGFDGETLTLQAPTEAVHSWLTQRLARELDEVVADVAPGVSVVVLAPEAAVVGAAA